MKKIIYLLLISFIIWSCDTPTVTSDNTAPEIIEVFAEYDKTNSDFWLQVEINHPMGISDVDTVWFEIITILGTEVLSAGLVDEGSNGDIVPDNGIYSSLLHLDESLPNDTYRVIVHVTDNTGNNDSKGIIIVVQEEYPPSIVSVEMPETYHLDPTQWGSLSIRVLIDDGNGREDIRWVRYAINTDYLTVDCAGNINPNPDEDNYYDDPTWTMNYTGTDSLGYLIYETAIPMRPVDDGEGGCGKTGFAFFRILTKDFSDQIGVESEILLEILKCGDGFCSPEFEDNTTCPEDCN